ncbi:hypothetical protein GCM10027342_02150 [Photobacterium alginatilyticum]
MQLNAGKKHDKKHAQFSDRIKNRAAAKFVELGEELCLELCSQGTKRYAGDKFADKAWLAKLLGDFTKYTSGDQQDEKDEKQFHDSSTRGRCFPL